MSLNRPQDRVVGVDVAGSGVDSQVTSTSCGWSAGGAVIGHSHKGGRAARGPPQSVTTD